MDETEQPPPEQAPEKPDLAAVVAWFEKHWKGEKSCPVCGTSQWAVAKDFVHAPIWTPQGGTFLGVGAYPLVMITCTVCAYAITFSAVRMGLIPKVRGNGK
jgi:hypothetical protein